MTADSSSLIGSRKVIVSGSLYMPLISMAQVFLILQKLLIVAMMQISLQPLRKTLPFSSIVMQEQRKIYSLYGMKHMINDYVAM